MVSCDGVHGVGWDGTRGREGQNRKGENKDRKEEYKKGTNLLSESPSKS